MHYDDGFDYIAPPEPPVQESKPAKLLSEDDHEHLWILPVAFLVTGIFVCVGLYKLVIWLLK